MIDEKKLIECLRHDISCFQINDMKDNEMYVRVDDMIRMIEGQPRVDEWIPCTERLPEKHVDVLVSFGDNEPVIAWHSTVSNKWRNSSTDIEIDDEVIAWMPLPEPYKQTREV